MLDGHGECLSFGGQVMKNVAGYDISRLQAGALGCLGLITEVSLKLLPLPEHSLTLAFDLAEESALILMNETAGSSAPITGACWVDGRCYLRLQGAEVAVARSANNLGGDHVSDVDAPWSQLREFDHPFLRGDAPLWRASVAATAPPLEMGSTLIDWGGAQRWLRGDPDQDALRARCSAAGGHASLFRGGDRSGETQQALSPVSQQLHQRLKQAFDPARILNPGRLYAGL